MAAGVVFALVLVSLFVARPFAIPSGSMEPTLRPGDRVLVDELAYDFGRRPQRGDVIVFDGRGSFDPVEDPAAGPAARMLRRTGAALGLTAPRRPTTSSGSSASAATECGAATNAEGST